MSYLSVESLEHSYGAVRALDRVSFTVAEGERLCLLGPSGCGKTTTLNAIAGFLETDSGKVNVKGETLTGSPPEARNIGIMFQNYALFPHMSVFDNVAFGLRMRKESEAYVRDRVMDMLRLVKLSHAANRSPKQLSGGEQQRIAFARAIAIKPALLLLDEPFSNLDARLKVEMRNELLGLLKPLKIATVMVTHDQEEAMAIADTIAVMRNGRIEQLGTAREIYHTPANLFVASFIGESNVLEGQLRSVSSGVAAVDVAGIGPVLARHSDDLQIGDQVQIIIRPEDIRIGKTPAYGNSNVLNRLKASLTDVTFLGNRTVIRVLVGDAPLVLSGNEQLASALDGATHGQTIYLDWDSTKGLIVKKEGTH